MFKAVAQTHALVCWTVNAVAVCVRKQSLRFPTANIIKEMNSESAVRVLAGIGFVRQTKIAATATLIVIMKNVRAIMAFVKEAKLA